MPSVTTWTRLEPSVTSSSMAVPLQGRLYDPLWLLARQWQLGEFKGDDGGTPVSVTVRGEVARLSRYRPGPPDVDGAQAVAYDARLMPLETLVEHERAGLSGGAPDAVEAVYTAAETGQHFLRLLAREPFATRYHLAFAAAFPLPRPADAGARSAQRDLRFLVVLAGRVPNGRTLADALRRDGLPSSLGIRPQDADAVARVGDRYLAWYDTFIMEPAEGDSSPAWSPERLEYACAVAAPSGLDSTTPGETVLAAREYYGGSLEWYDFDLSAGASLGAAGDRADDRAPRPFVSTTIPAPVTYRGMPAARWWEFEDAAVDLGAIDAEPDDLARMLLVEFAITFGNDWFVVPIDLDIGSLSRIHSLVVADTFGVRSLVPGIGASTHPCAGAWRMGCHAVSASGADATAPAGTDPGLLFLAPTLVRSIDGSPLDEVHVLRDEAANLAWGVERVAEGPSGRGVDQHEAFGEDGRLREGPAVADRAPGDEEVLVWQVATAVPDYWIPLVPVRAGTPDGAIRLRRGAMLSPGNSNGPRPARSRILMPDRGSRLDLFEEEVPREGIKVVRAFQWARWLDGKPLLWIGRRKSIGRGEGSSGLQFDGV